MLNMATLYCLPPTKFLLSKQFIQDAFDYSMDSSDLFNQLGHDLAVYCYLHGDFEAMSKILKVIGYMIEFDSF
jgi:hypothetical protein